MQLDLLANNTGNEKRKGRPAIHADAAARKRAHRASVSRIDYSDDAAHVAKMQEIADQLGCSLAQLMRSMTRVALINRNWKQVGLYGAKGH